MLRTHECGELRKDHVGQEVTLTGWVHRRRDHGDLIFVDLRDKYGLTQIKFDPSVNKEVHAQAEKLRSEWCIRATGEVLARPDGMTNDEMDTGAIEVIVKDMEIYSAAKTPPFEIDQDKDVGEETRLKYRFLDLRRDRLQKIMRFRADFIHHLRTYFTEKGFLEVQTPIVANSSPEGARDFLIPSRLHPGQFYALPQAPQQFKQLLMVGGVDKYFQIAPCFRDEDPRADRAACEFYQLDMEMSFVTQEDVFEVTEAVMVDVSNKFSDKELITPQFPRITYKDAMNDYGSDKPDLRYENKIVDVTDIVKDCEFSVFTGAVEAGGAVKALNVKGGAVCTRKQIDELTEAAKIHKAKGLAYIIKDAEGIRSPIIKFLSDDVQKAIYEATNFEEGDILFFAADKWEVACRSLGAVRVETAKMLDIADQNALAWCWIVDFPMYDYDDEKRKIDFSHNPFSMPQGGMDDLLNKDPLDILGYQYDLVFNGVEVSSGAVRNYDAEIMYKAFEIAGYSKEDVKEKFGHMLEAFEFGAPPHAGNAPGIDRIMMILQDLDNIRDIYAFPKSGRAQDTMLESPGAADPHSPQRDYISR